MIFKEWGLIACYQDYLGLPFGVIEDARIYAEGEALRQKRQEQARGR